MQSRVMVAKCVKCGRNTAAAVLSIDGKAVGDGEGITKTACQFGRRVEVVDGPVEISPCECYSAIQKEVTPQGELFT